ncbi:unnamed protein product, partial [marine sediment metagenome]
EEKKKRKVYGLFIAPKINEHAAHYFLQYYSALKVPNYGNVVIIPFDLDKWIDILSFGVLLALLQCFFSLT